MVQLSVPSPLTKSELAYEESLKETEEALANTSLLQLSPVPSLNLTNLQLESVVASLSLNLCFLISMLVASIVKTDTFQLWSFQLTRAQLCRQQSAEESLQQKELAAAYVFMAQFQDSPTRARQLQLSTAQLCRQQSAEESLRQEELAAAYVFMAQFQDSPTRARQLQLSTAQLCRQHSAEESLQQKELAATYVFMAQFQDSPTRARQLQLSTAQLCRQQSAEESLQQEELAAAYVFMAQFQDSPTRRGPASFSFQLRSFALPTLGSKQPRRENARRELLSMPWISLTLSGQKLCRNQVFKQELYQQQV